MRTFATMVDYGGTHVECPCETALLGRIGSELALIYHDTLQSPLPQGMQELVERLDHDAVGEDANGGER